MAEPWTIDKMITKGEDGAITAVHPIAIDKKFLNPELPKEWEEEYRKRIDFVVKHPDAVKAGGGNTFFENEKRNYGMQMLKVLSGDVEKGMGVLQQQDHQHEEWHRETAGIDWYACFTIKHQIRKLFYFGDLMKPEYREQMLKGAKLWTEKDPLRRPHYAHKPGAQGWGPDAKNSWVDVRTTDNLFLMRNTSVYLMAEATGNKETAAKYKEEFKRFVIATFRTTNGEWDSNNYLGHSIAPVHNMYDFAKDPEVVMLAKALLDWFYTAAALKYYRGGTNGPTKRDYNHTQPFGGSMAQTAWLFFGDTPLNPEHLESDEIHQITSNYRPPLAVLNLALKNFKKPVEFFAAKPNYDSPRDGKIDEVPTSHETYYIGDTFSLGSLAEGTGGGDVNGFKIIAFDSARGCVDIQPMPGPDPHYMGSEKYQSGKLAGPNRVAQYKNIAIWLVKKGDAPWFWLMPTQISVEKEKEITFFKAEKTWFAITPIELAIEGVSADLTKVFNTDKKGKEVDTGYHVVGAKGTGKEFCGFAIEIGEEQTHGTYEEFKKAVLAQSKVDAAQAEQGIVEYKSSKGTTVKMEYADSLKDYKVWRNGTLHDWEKDHRVVYRDADNTPGLIHADWGKDAPGTLTVHAGGATFTCTVDANGKVSWENK